MGSYQSFFGKDASYELPWLGHIWGKEDSREAARKDTRKAAGEAVATMEDTKIYI